MLLDQSAMLVKLLSSDRRAHGRNCKQEKTRISCLLNCESGWIALLHDTSHNVQLRRPNCVPNRHYGGGGASYAGLTQESSQSCVRSDRIRRSSMASSVVGLCVCHQSSSRSRAMPHRAHAPCPSHRPLCVCVCVSVAPTVTLDAWIL